MLQSRFLNGIFRNVASGYYTPIFDANDFLEMFHTYILYSKKLNSFYKGETGDIMDRLNRRNSGYEKATQSGVPWMLIWKGEKATKSEAKILERKLKNLSVKRTIEFILKYDEGVPSSDELLLVQKLSEC